MRIALFGASGRSGRLVVTEALAQGHLVTALVRNPERARLDPRVLVVRGDARTADAVHETIVGAGAVVSALGAPLARTFTQEGRVGTYATPVIVEAMQGARVRRLIVMSAYFAGDGRARLSRLGRFWLPIVMRGESQDKDELERIVRASDLDWTIVRPVNMSDRPATGDVEEDPIGVVGLGSWIPRGDVAAFMLRILDDRSYFGRVVLIRGRRTP